MPVSTGSRSYGPICFLPENVKILYVHMDEHLIKSIFTVAKSNWHHSYPESKSRNILQLHHLRGSICRWTFVPVSLLFPLAVLKQGTSPNTQNSPKQHLEMTFTALQSCISVKKRYLNAYTKEQLVRQITLNAQSVCLIYL